LGSIANVFRDLNAPWFVFGAQALAMHGVPRATADVDVTVRWDGNAADLVRTLGTHGFRINLEMSGIESFVQQTRVIPAVHRSSNIPLDIVLAGPGLEELMLDRAVVLTLAGRKVPVIAMEDFLVLKILAGRRKDDQDVQLLLAARAKDIDIALVTRRIEELERLLDQSDLSPKWRDLSNHHTASTRRKK
jgi:hypothetical protein